MRFDIVTIFPEMFDGPLNHSIIGRAQEKNIVNISVHNLRKWTHDKHQITDDSPYGGGAGMVMKPAPFSEAVAELKQKNEGAKVVLMTPQGEPFCDAKARKLAKLPGLIILCGRYEGVDERVRLIADMEISIGDYVLTGGELPAMVLVDSVARLNPGVVKEAESTQKDSHAENLLEHPHYTRPPEFMGEKVPDVLLSGDHGKIEKWRREQAIIRTAQRRPDLIAKADLTNSEKELVRKITVENND
ncbi:tRNA (guanine(37)-N(1))-methyltransferase [hydrothermal vent metagenome]|uniref:tRNA (guanine-N(1)-)-methyltransferase n=1 Tax=hydrothermal vent metagenome TaxID=652676 RepID=A0A3B1CC14_9ZZZZ